MLLSRSSWKMPTVILFSIFSLLIACASGGRKAESQSQEQPATQEQPAKQEQAQKAETGAQPEAADPPLTKKYNSIVVSSFTMAPPVKQDYPDAARECQANLITALQMQNAFASVSPVRPGASYPDGTLLIKAEVTDMRMVNSAARFWGGAWAGSSYMNLDVVFVDAATNQEIRKKAMSSATNAWAAAWTGGASDRSLPADMGRIIAEYVLAVVPSK